jgi:hypothetical protein
MITCLLNHSYRFCTNETKTKLEYPLTLSKVKRHLRIDQSFVDDDDYLDTLIKVATTIAEDYIEKDIAKTKTDLRIDNFSGSSLTVHAGNFISVESVLNSDDVSIGTIHFTTKTPNAFHIEWESSISSKPLFVSYLSGYLEKETPVLIEHAILIIIASLYDSQRSNISWSGYQDNLVWQKILDPYKLIRF